MVVGDAGIAIIERGEPALFLPWYAVGHIEFGQSAAGAPVIRMHLADGRTATLPAPGSQTQAAAEIFRAWRGYSKKRIHEPHDEIPPEFRAAAARTLDPVQDAVPSAGRSFPDPIRDGVSSAGRRILSLLALRRR